MRYHEIMIAEAADPVEEWNGKHVVAYRQGYRIVVDEPGNASYVTAWTADNKRVGTLSTRTTPDPVGRDYLSISSVEVDPKHRKKGLGVALYRALMAHLAPRWKGIGSYLPDQANRRQVPKIWARIGGYISPLSADHIVADRIDEAAGSPMRRYIDIVEAVERVQHGHLTIPVFRDPGETQLLHVLARSREHEMRGLLEGGEAVWWDGYLGTHYGMAHLLGITYSNDKTLVITPRDTAKGGRMPVLFVKPPQYRAVLNTPSLCALLQSGAVQTHDWEASKQSGHTVMHTMTLDELERKVAG